MSCKMAFKLTDEYISDRHRQLIAGRRFHEKVNMEAQLYVSYPMEKREIL